ncbi:primosomal protein N' [Orrella marina]|uniref:Replication restart protein PriA n=1 Tax=Orrella marina TaxID=2163011 RepID=A0A2R4XMX0_9BURK|nr:primosomal protein N' [Orrella marina]AWB35059.1 primosomal protein N' [Orrella marina]
MEGEIGADSLPTTGAENQYLFWAKVALDVPIGDLFEYEVRVRCEPGQRVIVPFGQRTLIGVVVSVHDEPSMASDQVRPVMEVLDDLPVLSTRWLAMASFAARYYHRTLGEVILPAIPVTLRKPASYLDNPPEKRPVARLRKRLAKLSKQSSVLGTIVAESTDTSVSNAIVERELTHDQRQAVEAIDAANGFQTFLLFGVTGAGKTEVYLQAAIHVLRRGGSVLFLVPEINLTPQFAAALGQRLQDVVDAHEVALMHSGLSDGQRSASWLAILEGQARVVLGTRLAIFAPLPRVDLIVVDEEHDASYKQQEGLRYSARDLAVWRAHQHRCPVILGSATPSLESWWHAQRGRYHRLNLTERALTVPLPSVRLVDTRRLQLEQGISPQVSEAMRETLEGGQQVLVYLNRRGYAPVLHCQSCGWLTQCQHCSVFTVLHKAAGKMRLHCHHCGVQRQVPRACPECGDQDLQPMGRGTQRLEEFLQTLFPDRTILRIDADSTRTKGSAQKLFDHVHSGKVDILVGTQMVSKGHDFRNLGLVVVLNSDAALFSQDFRAPERLFAQLVQVSGRAGRHTGEGKVIVQTDYPEQSVYQALIRHDYEGFARSQIAEREQAGLPPFSFQALMTAQAKELPVAVSFLEQARESAQTWLASSEVDCVMLYDVVPLRVVRVAGQCRAQLLIESSSRVMLQRLLSEWLPELGSRFGAAGLRWQIEVDPLEI